MENSSSENLDDGELWLPSDIFPVEETVSSTSNKLKNNNPIASSLCCCYSCVLLLRHHHNSIFMAEQQVLHSVPKPFPITERRFRPAERCCTCTDCSISDYFERSRRETTGPPPVYPPVQLHHQKEEQSRFIGIQRRNLGLNRFAGNWVSPFVGGGGNGGGSGGGFNGESSSVRDYGGTGVFLPRIPTNINNNGGKKQGGRNRQDVQQTDQRYPCI
ncbi:uncharacterized protein LOC107014998 isoform X2 [Solanum pennellii]|uniref:Uncharacterized protein LOC107014998 isoform X2 n=1 Tax=Solanum pennellii TaxID=28526 RepID=A0ABM1GG55_SOLPN|nr:uncharacterized protein LOC107014998 isoform X2 [Solanum pennellii]